MNTIEEQLWNYIDGNCTEAERAEIAAKIAVNLQYHQLYQELLAVNVQLNELDFEAPSMSFTRNVMEQVNLEIKPVALKTKVNENVIYAIGSFFLLALLSILGYALATSNLNFTVPKINLSLNSELFESPIALQIFLMVDMVLALIYLDYFFRKRKLMTQKKGV